MKKECIVKKAFIKKVIWESSAIKYSGGFRPGVRREAVK